jgi:hypothetical protein
MCTNSRGERRDPFFRRAMFRRVDATVIPDSGMNFLKQGNCLATDVGEPLGQFAKSLLADIEADRDVLRGLAEQVASGTARSRS